MLALSLANGLAIPASIAAVLAVLAYLLGFLHPVRIKRPRYLVRKDAGPIFTCYVKNRKFYTDRTLTGLILQHVPRFRRLRWKWGRVQTATYIPSSEQIGEIRDKGIVITKSNEIQIKNCDILDSTARPIPAGQPLASRTFVVARFGSSRPAVKKVKRDR
jgi:hypothetical protein